MGGAVYIVYSPYKRKRPWSGGAGAMGVIHSGDDTVNCLDSNRSDSARQVRVTFPGGETAATYHLEQAPSGNIILVRDDGLPIGDDERNIIADAVTMSARFQRVEAQTAQARTIVPQARWLFPTSNREVRGKQQGVYFVTDQAFPNMIKIGFTGGSFVQRANHLRRAMGCVEPQIIAVAQTHEYRALETGLHAYFSHSHIEGEWFALEPVIEWLGSVRAGGVA